MTRIDWWYENIDRNYNEAWNDGGPIDAWLLLILEKYGMSLWLAFVFMCHDWPSARNDSQLAGVAGWPQWLAWNWAPWADL
jgi:hypothetical protein